MQPAGCTGDPVADAQGGRSIFIYTGNDISSSNQIAYKLTPEVCTSSLGSLSDHPILTKYQSRLGQR